uniref:Retrovirus-related Pol polyprotein from transposon TNT 1-94 n=1 Tax=Tanacetum cinerariifolium TaxID=118510 RepID=A0A6L2JJL2_TANCI|nr:hypothetical protein [Tanacetum cinerariifolium]
MRFVSKSDDFHVYGALLFNRMTNQQMLESDAYKTYLAYATEEEEPEPANKVVPTKKPATKRQSSGISIEKALKRSKRETIIHQAGGLSEGADSKSKVPNEPKGKSVNRSDSGDEDADDQQGDDERTESDDEPTETDNPKTSDDEEEIQDVEFVHTLEDYVPSDDESNDVTEEEYERINEELYGDVNVSLTDVEPADKEKDDVKMTVVGHVNVYQEDAGNQVKDDAHVTQKNDAPIPSSSISSYYVAKFLNFSNIPSTYTEVVSMMDINVQHELPRTSSLLTIYVSIIPEQDKTTLFETMTKSKSFNKSLKQRALYHALVELILEDKDAMDEGVAEKLKKRKPNDADKDEGPFAGSSRGLKRQKTSKDTKQSKKAKSTENSKGTSKSQPKPTGKSVQVEDIVFTAGDAQGPQNLRKDTANINEPPVVNVDLTDWLKKPERPLTLNPEWNKALTDQLDWNNPKGDRYPFDLSKPLPLVMLGNHQIVSVDYFFNNDLAYLQGGSTSRTYTTSLTKIKALHTRVLKDKYSTDMLPTGSPNMMCTPSKEFLQYKCEFPRLHLHDIKDMLILLLQNRLFNLEGDVIVHLVAALHMFTRRIAIQKRVEDL